MSFYFGGELEVLHAEVEEEWALIPTETYPPLTFGVEIELAVATLDPYDKNLQPKDPRIAYLLDANGYRDVWTYENICSHIATTLTKADVRNSWIVKRGYSILAKSTSWGIEVVSPVLAFSDESLRLVDQVYETLQSKYRIELNKSTGLHVHVGDHDLGFDFSSMQRLAGILWTFDAQISTIHSEYRKERSQYCADFRNRSVLRSSLDNDFVGLEPKLRQKALAESLDLRGIHNIFHATTSTLKLKELMAPNSSALAMHRREPYFIRNVDNAMKSGMVAYQPTVEFRQHVSTLDSQKIRRWIGLCVRLVDFSCKVDSSRLIPFLKLNMKKSAEEFPLGALLRLSGMDEEAAYYDLQIPIEVAGRQKERNRRRKAGEQEDEILFATR